MALSVKLNVFEGPLDLLLHLIDKNKIDIYDIPIVEITDQYMEYLHSMEKEDLGIMSEFLVMAATLLDIKCKMLLPKEVNEEGEEEDPRAELVQKLLEYKMYKYMSYELRDRLGDAAGVYYRKQDLPEEVLQYTPPSDPQELLRGLTLERMSAIYQALIRRQENKIDPIRSKFGRIEKEEISLSDGRSCGITPYCQSDPSGSDNNGKYHPKYDDPLSGRRAGDPDHRARKLLSALYKKRIL